MDLDSRMEKFLKQCLLEQVPLGVAQLEPRDDNVGYLVEGLCLGLFHQEGVTVVETTSGAPRNEKVVKATTTVEYRSSGIRLVEIDSDIVVREWEVTRNPLSFQGNVDKVNFYCLLS